eukprot:6660393-Prymnesium_polylepis.2
MSGMLAATELSRRVLRWRGSALRTTEPGVAFVGGALEIALGGPNTKAQSCGNLPPSSRHQGPRPRSCMLTAMSRICYTRASSPCSR